MRRLKKGKIMGIIINGVYYKDQSPETVHQSVTLKEIHKDGVVSSMAKAHAHNLIQPHNQDGTPNQDFIDYHPESAKAHGFIKEDKEN